MRLFTRLIILLILPLFVLFHFFWQVNHSHGKGNVRQDFEIKKGEGIKEIGKNLEESQLIKSKYYFYYYIWKMGGKDKLQAGKYELRGSLTVPEIVQIFSVGETIPQEIRITFPEGASAEQMAEILGEKGFNKDNFLRAVAGSDKVKTDYNFLKDRPRGKSLEGYLFPDTYFFWREADAGDIINRMLLNFDEKLTKEMREEIKNRGRTIYKVVTMASILEKEVKSFEDMKIVSGIFWKRLDQNKPLQSCATIAYILKKEKKQYSYEDTRVKSPYNTYINKGLPPGPINNPGLNSITAAIYPTETEYNYFLTDPETGKTVYSKTVEEHEENKKKYGL